MSSSPKPLHLALALATLAAGAALTAFACGPFFPSWLLGGDAPLAGPTALFNREIERRLPSGLPHSIVRPEGVDAETMRADTTRADREDLAAALERDGIAAPRRQELLAAHEALRQSLGSADTAAAVPAGLPEELALYLEGAVAYHREDAAGAAAAWRKLLGLPAEKRHFRSTWAAYMLGRLADPDDEAGDDQEAIGWYRRTRELAAQGFADTLHLAATSLAWEARRAAKRGDWAAALRLYAEAQRQGEATALLSLRQTCRAALAGTAPRLAELAADPAARPIVTTFLLAAWPGDAAGGARMKAWLAAVRRARVRDAAEAADLAWAAYLAGDYRAASSWLKHAPHEAPMARWVEARLLLRQGRTARAAALLDGLAHDFPGPDLSIEDGDWLYEAAGPPAATRTRAAGEAGVAWLHQGRYDRALDRFLAGGYWFDAAYVAERVLTVDELARFVDALPPEAKNPPADAGAADAPAGDEGDDEMAVSGGLRAPNLASLHQSLRNLLGRRLARAGRFGEARRYLPAELAAPLSDRAAAARPGADAAAIWKGACAARHQGMELLGSEIGPDWFYFGGQLQAEFAPLLRPSALAPTAGERRRAAASAIHPDRRFHYRYVAVQEARQAAARLPDGTEEKARWLASAGTWLKYRDPAAALPSYRELARCCGSTGIGREARRLHWIPDTDACLEAAP